MTRLTSLLLLTVIFWLPVQSQEIWSLEDCVRHALENSLLIDQAEINRDFAVVDQRQARESRYPSLNGSGRVGLNFGRTINPSTNDFETENSLYNSFSLNTGLSLYQGNVINNSIKQTNINLQAAEEDIRQTKSDLALQVALSYLNALFADENLRNARSALQLTEAQLEQLDRLIAAGARPEAERYDILAQIALDEQNIVNHQNSYDQSTLALKHLMLLEPEYPLQIEKPEISLDNIEAFETYELTAVYGAALSAQPQIKAQELRIESARLGEKISQAQLYPSLSAGASIGTNYSDLAMTILGFQTQRVTVPGVYINNEEVLYQVDQEVPTSVEETPYFDQLDNNLGYGFSVNLSIPLYNNYQGKAGVERAKLNTLLEQSRDTQIKQNLKTEIQDALASARASREALEAAERAAEAAEIAYTNAQRRFDLGALNSYDLINARNRLDAAQVSLSISKYDYLFKVKVIEYYLGRGLSLD